MRYYTLITIGYGLRVQLFATIADRCVGSVPSVSRGASEACTISPAEIVVLLTPSTQHDDTVSSSASSNTTLLSIRSCECPNYGVSSH